MKVQLTVSGQRSYPSGGPVDVEVTLTNSTDEAISVRALWHRHLVRLFYRDGSRTSLPLRPPGIPPPGGIPTERVSLAPGDSLVELLDHIDFFLASPIADGTYRLVLRMSEPAESWFGGVTAETEPLEFAVGA